MSNRPAWSGKDLVKALRSFGFEDVRIRGSHHFLKHPDGRATVIPVHTNESIGPGLFSKILRECELTREEIAKVL
jgi:predicted RNA binding protein YcfA (HicA-like mRNA interferase family)